MPYKKYIISTFLILFVFNVYSQKPKTYYINWKGERTSKGFANYKREILKKDKIFFVKDFYLNGALKMEGVFNNKSLMERTGTFKYYYLNGNISRIIEYNKGKKHGEFKKYFINGELSKSGNYDNDKMIGKWTYFTENGSIECEIENTNEDKFKDLYRSPIYPGGKEKMNEYIKKVITPLSTLGDNFYGRSSAYFNIDSKGKVDDVDILLHGTIEMDSIIIKHILNMPNWEPALKNGKPTSYRYYLPLKFQSNREHKPLRNKKVAKGFFFSGIEDYKKGNYEEARIKFKQAVLIDDSEAKYYYYLGHGYYITENTEFACEYWKIAEMLDDKILKKEIKDLCNIK